MIDFNPEDVHLNEFGPLTGSLGRVEREITIAYLIRFLQIESPTKWKEIDLREVSQFVTESGLLAREPEYTWMMNPFLKIDLIDTFVKGYLEQVNNDENCIRITEKALEGIRKHVRRKPRAILCEKCHRGPLHGVDLFRINEKGVEGIWRCREHLENNKIDPEVYSIVSALSVRMIKTEKKEEKPASCEICHRGPLDGVDLFTRDDIDKGAENSVWRCREHLEKE